MLPNLGHIIQIPSCAYGSVIVSIPASSAVDRGFQLRPIETKDYEIGCFSSKHSLESG
jgi:hypothetical protein